MKNGNIINVARLTDGSFTAYHRDALEAAKKLPLDSFKAELETYTKMVDEFSAYTSNTEVSDARKVEKAALAERNKCFSKFRIHVKSLCDVPNESVQALGLAIWNQIKGTYGAAYTDKDNYTKMVDTTLMNVTTLVASEPYATAFKGSTAEMYFNKLAEAETAFVEANTKSYEASRKHKNNSNKALRESCMKQFYIIRNHANYVAETEGNEACANFVRELELMANTRRSLYTMRTKANKAEKNEASDASATQDAEIKANETAQAAETKAVA